MLDINYNEYIQYDIEEAITNYISYVENNCAKTKYIRELVRNGYKALDNKDLQLEYLISGFNSMLSDLQLDERFGKKYRLEKELFEEEYNKIFNENWSIKQKYKVPDFRGTITEHINYLEHKQVLNKYQLKSLERCKSALDNAVEQEKCVEYIIRDLKIELEIKNKLKGGKLK